MRFNRYLWSLYKESSQGADAIRIFGNVTKNSNELDALLLDAGLELPQNFFDLDFTVPHIANRDPEETRERFGSDQISICISESVKEHLRGHRISSLDDAREIIEKIVSEGVAPYAHDLQGNYVKVLEPSECESRWEDFPAVTMGLNLSAPDYFLPYFFTYRFNRLADLAQEFDIPLPAIPSKRDHVGRLLYYAEITNHFYEFRTQYGLSSSEMSAFLYSFGLNCTPQIQGTDELPQPSKAWFIGAPPDFIEDYDHDKNYYWQGNSAIREGDIVVMYCTSPVSAVHSVWRALSDGYDDPFFYYYGMIHIGFPITTPQVPYNEMKNDPVLSRMGLVRSNMQGVNGRPISNKEYEALFRLMRCKGAVHEKFPQIKRIGSFVGTDISDERDVEEKLIEPLLYKLGYNEEDWMRQMPVRMGRGIRYYSDYAIGAVLKRGNESAKLILEAKYTTSNHDQLFEAYEQGKSYALRLQAPIMVVASQEGISIFKFSKYGFRFTDNFQLNWSEISDPDTFHQVENLIGRKSVLGRKKRESKIHEPT